MRTKFPVTVHLLFIQDSRVFLLRRFNTGYEDGNYSLPLSDTGVGTGGRVDFFFNIEAWDGEPFNAEPDKCDELRWCDLDALPENIIPYVKQAIQNFRDGIVFDEFGWRTQE